MDRTDIYRLFELKSELFKKCFEIVDKKVEKLLCVTDVHNIGGGMFGVMYVTRDGNQSVQNITLKDIEE